MEEKRRRMICDGHAHLGTEQEQNIRREYGIMTMVCAGTRQEAEALLTEAQSGSLLIPAVGLHPWHSGECTVEEMLPFMKQVPVIGEIGLDSVWCQVPMECQRTAFKAQLEIAVRLNKPVVLHTKGMEEEIAKTIQNYKTRFLVHWYSSMEYLDPYLAKDCYFTLGPDLAVNPAVRQVAQRVPLNRLMVETDGFSAVSWAVGETPYEDVPGLLDSNMRLVAEIKGVPAEQVYRQMEQNFFCFIGKGE